MAKNQKDAKLNKLLGNLLALIKKHGSRSRQVKKFVQKNKNVNEFPKLAATMIFAFENKQK